MVPGASWPGAPGPRRMHIALREVWLEEEGGRESGGLGGPRRAYPTSMPQQVTSTANKRTWGSQPSPALPRAPSGRPGMHTVATGCLLLLPPTQDLGSSPGQDIFIPIQKICELVI